MQQDLAGVEPSSTKSLGISVKQEQKTDLCLSTIKMCQLTALVIKEIRNACICTVLTQVYRYRKLDLKRKYAAERKEERKKNPIHL
jgi:hypothetical protein